MIPCAPLTKGEPDCIFAPSTVANSDSSASERNQISASLLLQGIVIRCWSTAAVNYSAPTQQNSLLPSGDRVKSPTPSPSSSPWMRMWEDAGGVLHLHGWREALLWGICRSSDDLARVPSTFTTRAFAAWPHATLQVECLCLLYLRPCSVTLKCSKMSSCFQNGPAGTQMPQWVHEWRTEMEEEKKHLGKRALLPCHQSSLGLL